jgi:hypothetical protein
MTRFAKPSPAMAVAFVALVAALSGSAIALPGSSSIDKNDIKKNAVTSKTIKNNSLKGADVRNNTLRGADINESSLGKVPSAGAADSAVNAGNAATLGGQAPGAFQGTAVEAPRLPAFGPSWESNGDEDATFYKDRGRVYLQGDVTRFTGTDDRIFTLPPGYRPPGPLYFITYGSSGSTAWVYVNPDGSVNFYNGDDGYIGLTNISFRAAG